MSNKTQLQENNSTLEYVLEQLETMPTTEDCMREIEELQDRVTPIDKGGTGATTAEEALTNLGGAKIEAGTYVGTGTKGSISYANTLTFDTMPKVVFVYGDKSKSAFPIIMLQYCTSAIVLKEASTIVCEWNDNTLKWFGDTAAHQCNNSEQTYNWCAIY